jgi:hypothetical protein
VKAQLVTGLAVAVTLGAPARAEVMRLGWRGVQASGAAPARLEKVLQGHLAVALKQRGTELAAGPPVDAEASAHCAFTRNAATCVVEVVHPADGVRAERKAEIPFHDAEDLAESLALLVTETLETDLRDALVAAPHEPEPKPAPPTKPTPRAQPPAPAGHEPSPPLQPEPTLPSTTPPTGGAATARVHRAQPATVDLELGPAVALGFAGEPPLYGAIVRGEWARGVVRVGGTLSMTGASVDRSPWHLGVFRLLTGPRVGAGVERRLWSFGATAGPALLVLAIDAHVPDGTHTLATFAACGGVRLAVHPTRALALAVTADAAVAVSRERVEAGGQPVQVFDVGSVELALTLAYRF